MTSRRDWRHIVGIEGCADASGERRSQSKKLTSWSLTWRTTVVLCALLVLLMSAWRRPREPISTQLVRMNFKWTLLRGGKPYIIKGAGGNASKELLKAIGG